MDEEDNVAGAESEGAAAAAGAGAVDAWAPLPPIDEHAVLARVKERQALHELIRLGGAVQVVNAVAT
jgi:hypothetical protein